MGPGAVVGPSGVPVAVGAPVGPSGVPMAAAPVGPPGVPVKRARRGVAWHRAVLIGGAVAVVAIVAVVAVVAASPGDSPASVATPAPTEASAVVAVAPTTDAVATVATVTTEVAATTTVTIAATTVPQSGAPTCVVGSWLADNHSVAKAVIGSAETLGGLPIEDGDVTGEARLVIAADGTIVTTFDNWLLTSPLPEGIGSATIAETGTETHTLSFADDGSYSITASSSQTRMTLSLAGSVLFDNLVPSGVLASAGTYTCAGDQLIIVEPSNVLITETFTRNG